MFVWRAQTTSSTCERAVFDKTCAMDVAQQLLYGVRRQNTNLQRAVVVITIIDDRQPLLSGEQQSITTSWSGGRGPIVKLLYAWRDLARHKGRTKLYMDAVEQFTQPGEVMRARVRYARTFAA